MKQTFILTSFLVQTILAQNSFFEKWLTYFEKSNYKKTLSYEETISYFKKLEKNSSYGKLISIGKSAEGREIYVFIASKDKAFDPFKARKVNKPIILIQNGIHAGEIDGKDASMILLRQILITKEKFAYLDNAILLIIPIFNVDGHERSSPYSRINQNGPEEMGWRTNAQNLNLNRDYMKADSPEMKAWLKFFNSWLPHVFVDCHVTDGADYQYEITYSCERYGNVHPFLGSWIQKEFIPFFESEVKKEGFLIAPYAWFRGDEIESGIVDGITSPRLSTGYVALQNRVALLIETHMLKDYKTRVFATLAMLDAVIRKVNSTGSKLVVLINKADTLTVQEFSIKRNFFPLKFTITNRWVPFNFKGYKFIKMPSKISGKDKIVYTNEKIEQVIPLFNESIVTDSIQAPFAYIIPQAYQNIVEILQLHGIKVNRVKSTKKIEVEKYRFDEKITWASYPYEGRITVNTKYYTFKDSILTRPNDYIIYTNQRGIRVLLHLLEPKSSDSFVYWGFFNAIFERKEYYEDYVLEKLAEVMYEKDQLVRKEFEQKLQSDSIFASSPQQRLEFFYRKSPYFDKNWLVYPIVRVSNPIELEN